MPDFGLADCLKRISSALALTIVLAAVSILPGVSSAQNPVVNPGVLIPAPPQLAADGYLLIDAASGKVLVEHNARQLLPPASLTKMMTSYIVSAELEKGRVSLEDQVPISVKAWSMGGSKMFIKEGTSVPLEKLLRGVIIQSGNDASVALAEYVAGGESAFADIMNQQAFLLGMRDTHFKNATGWPAEGHLTTAYDLSLLARALINDFPEEYALYSEKQFSYNGITQNNRNGLLWRDKYVDGIKTGHTDEAGYCLVASALRDGMRLVSVVMGASSERSREQETQKLLSYGFRYYENHDLYQAGEVLNTSKVWGGAESEINLVLKEPLTLTIPKGQRDALNAKIALDDVIVAPVEQGAELGRLRITLRGEELASVPLIAEQSVEEGNIFGRMFDQILLMAKDLFDFS